MYVCLCNPVTDREIRGCVRQGARTLSDLQMQLGVAAQCGMCAASALAIVREEACCASIAENDHLPAAA
ncbi:MAG: (2Fe-2S)-binding protein [Burkholderiales bacterium]|nr:(2Fe-2S)-binding protein [Burkholderiales bacterium]